MTINMQNKAQNIMTNLDMIITEKKYINFMGRQSLWIQGCKFLMARISTIYKTMEHIYL